MKSTKRRTPLVLIAAVLALACGLFTVTSASAGAADACVLNPDDYGMTPVLAATPTSVKAGADVQITGSGFPANCEVTLQVAGTTIGTATTNGDGSFTFTWSTPADQKPGNTTIVAAAGGQTLATTVVEIVANGSVVTTGPTTSVGPAGGGGTGGSGTGGTGTTGGSTLPATGAQIGILVVGGLVMLAAGFALLLWNRGRGVSTQH